MPVKIQPTYTKAKAKRIVCMGDSHTFNYVLGLSSADFYPNQLQKLLWAAGANALARNMGISGDTTAQMIVRKSAMTRWETPDLAVIYAGQNDTSAANITTVASGASASQFTVQAGKGIVYKVGAWILVGAESTQVTVQSTDVLTVSPALSGTPSGGTSVQLDTRKNLVVLGQASGASRIVIVNAHYLNYSTGGDTLATPLAGNVALRALQSAAATDLGAAYCDLYTFMRNRIVAGTDAQGSFSWHVLDSNSHLNTYGEGILASAVLATIQAQTGWMDALT